MSMDTLVTNEWLETHRPSTSVTTQMGVWWADIYGWTIESPDVFYRTPLHAIIAAINAAGARVENIKPKMNHPHNIIGRKEGYGQ